jgi:hypothetical protein
VNRRILTPVARIVRRRNPRTGRLEIWSAESADGLYSFERIEDTTTPWEVWSRGQFVTSAGSLPKARAATAARALARQEESAR